VVVVVLWRVLRERRESENSWDILQQLMRNFVVGEECHVQTFQVLLSMEVSALV
jgi:hypothetical protein